MAYQFNVEGRRLSINCFRTIDYFSAGSKFYFHLTPYTKYIPYKSKVKKGTRKK